MENQDNTNYFILFPTHLLDTLNPKEAILMGVLISLAKREGYAYPSNRMLEETLKMSTSSVARTLKKLETERYINRELIYNDKGEVTQRRIYILPSLVKGGIPKNEDTPMSEMPIPPSQNRQLYNIHSINKDNSIRDNKAYTEAFEILWQSYGKRGNKQTSRKAFLRLSDKDKRAMIQRIPEYVTAHQNANKMEFLPHLSTFINQRRWEDELPYQDKINPNKQLIDWNEN